MRRILIALFVGALLFGGGLALVNAQQAGGAFVPSFSYIISGVFNFTNGIKANGTTVSVAQLADGKSAGNVLLGGSNPTAVTMSPFTAIKGCTVSLAGAGAPGLDPTQVSAAWSGTTLNIYAWKPTASGDATLIASTSTTRSISYVCIGSL